MWYNLTQYQLKGSIGTFIYVLYNGAKENDVGGCG